MKTKMVSYTLDTLPPRTEADHARLKALAARPDSEIDFSDIPEITDEQFKNAVRGRFHRPAKLESTAQEITTRIDTDVLDWLKSENPNFHSRLNAILRREMLASAKQA